MKTDQTSAPRFDCAESTTLSENWPSLYPERGTANHPASDTGKSSTRAVAAVSGSPIPLRTKMNVSAEAPGVFLQAVSAAVELLKQQLRQDYEQAYPDLREIIHLILDEEEAKAWELSSFPHLLLPDLVEAHVANLNLQPAETKHDDVVAPDHFFETSTYQPTLALCGS